MTSYWRVWGVEDGEVRVARDLYESPPPGPQIQPQHLELNDKGYVKWAPHSQGAVIPSIPLNAFVAWLDQGGS